MGRILRRVLLVAGVAVVTGSTAAGASGTGTLMLPGQFFPESVTAAPNGTLFVSSLTTGDIVRFAPGSSESTTFVTGVNVGTAGVMADPDRGLLWACAVDIFTGTASALRAFDLRTGALKASYPIPDGGVCGDIALARGDVYVTDTLLGRILRPTNGRDRALEVWSPQLADGGFPNINGIAYDGRGTLYTTNYSTGELFAIRIEPGGSAATPVLVPLNEPMLINPDGIRWRMGFLYVADNTLGVVRVDPRTGATTVIDDSLEQPSSLVFVGDGVWVTEGQIFHIPTGDPPFRVVHFSL